MPNGTSAPGNVFSAPPPVPKSGPPGCVPANGLTYWVRSGPVAAAGAVSGRRWRCGWPRTARTWHSRSGATSGAPADVVERIAAIGRRPVAMRVEGADPTAVSGAVDRVAGGRIINIGSNAAERVV